MILKFKNKNTINKRKAKVQLSSILNIIVHLQECLEQNQFIIHITEFYSLCNVRVLKEITKRNNKVQDYTTNL